MTPDLTFPTKRRIVGILFFLSGALALVYEVVWIRLFAISFGNTAQAMSMVLSVYLGGIATGAAAGRRLTRRSAAQCLRLYGMAELLVSLYAFLVPYLLRGAAPLFQSLYAEGHGATGVLTGLHALAGSAILFPATSAMGATLPLLARWIAGAQDANELSDAARRVSNLYSVNLAGASAGAILCGFALLPAFGFAHTLVLACSGNALIGLASMWLARGAARKAPATQVRPAAPVAGPALPGRVIIPVAFFGGWTCFLYEVAWGRLYGLLFGPTASTVTLVLAAFLVGLTVGGVWAGRLRRNLPAWLCGAQAGCALALLWAIAAAGALPPWIADWVRVHNPYPVQIEFMKVAMLVVTLLPLTLLFGLIFPLTMRAGSSATATFAGWIGGLYGVNTVGCIAGAVAAGWWLVPAVGTERTLLLGGLVNLALALLVLHRIRPRWRTPALAVATVGALLVGWLFPRWDMAAMTAGGYKYAPYYTGSGALQAGELVWVHEGIAGTVAVRRDAGSLILSIDGKVDASDAGGDLLTEKLLAHLPLLLAPQADRVCLIGLASGVTAGAALTHSIRQLDVVEVSPDVIRASHDFDRVNRRPLEDRRTTLIVNDGRNHLALTSSRYDVIISEPSNPWIAGMNNLFTRDFFRIARGRLRPAGIFAQWFHIYNMPRNDLRSLVAAFADVFPSAALWKLNDGDILLTGFAADPPFLHLPAPAVPPAALADLAAVGVENPELLLDLYVMRDGALQRFAGGAEPNTDDHPWLEFHGQQDLHAQTDPANEAALFSSIAAPPPASVRRLRESLGPAGYLAIGRMFERAESYRSAFGAYQQAQRQSPSVEALAAMDRCARLPGERTAVIAALGLAGSSDGLEAANRPSLAGSPGGPSRRRPVPVRGDGPGPSPGCGCPVQLRGFLYGGEKLPARHPAVPAGDSDRFQILARL